MKVPIVHWTKEIKIIKILLRKNSDVCTCEQYNLAIVIKDFKPFNNE